jgi:hypothetical protein
MKTSLKTLDGKKYLLMNDSIYREIKGAAGRGNWKLLTGKDADAIRQSLTEGSTR